MDVLKLLRSWASIWNFKQSSRRCGIREVNDTEKILFSWSTSIIQESFRTIGLFRWHTNFSPSQLYANKWTEQKQYFKGTCNFNDAFTLRTALALDLQISRGTPVNLFDSPAYSAVFSHSQYPVVGFGPGVGTEIHRSRVPNLQEWLHGTYNKWNFVTAQIPRNCKNFFQVISSQKNALYSTA